MRLSATTLRRLSRKPPRYLARRALDEARREGQRFALTRAARGKGSLAANRTLGAEPGAVLRKTAAAPRLLKAFEAAAATVASEPGLRESAMRRAGLAKDHVLQLFGDRPIELGRRLDWNTDPRSGHRWPTGYHRRLDYRQIGNPCDVKVTWELSRLRHCVHLAQGAALGDREALAVLEQDLASWRQDNPVGWSVNWSSAMEVALRAVNLVCVDQILLAGGSPQASRRELVASLYQHGWFLARNLEVSDVNGNHFLANAVGLLWLGSYFEGVGEAADWYRRGLAMMREAVGEQVLADGLDHEGSLPYHLLVCEMMLAARVAGGDDLQEADGVLSRMLDALVAVTGPAGRIPDLGDDDGGRVFAFTDASSQDARRVLALGGALLGHAEATRAAGGAHVEDELWLTGRIADIGGAGKVRMGTLLADGGVAVLGAGADHVVVDVGRVGFRGRGGHGHLDALSFEATLGGDLAVRDSGTGSYTGDPGLRNELRDVTAHSVAVVDGLPYARAGGVDALWSIEGDSPPTGLHLRPGSDMQILEAEQLLPAKHGQARVRRVFEWTPGELTVSDHLAAPAGAEVVELLQLPEGCERSGPATLASSSHEYELEVGEGASLGIEPCLHSRRYGSVESGVRAAVRLTSDGGETRILWRIRAR